MPNKTFPQERLVQGSCSKSTHKTKPHFSSCSKLPHKLRTTYLRSILPRSMRSRTRSLENRLDLFMERARMGQCKTTNKVGIMKHCPRTIRVQVRTIRVQVRTSPRTSARTRPRTRWPHKMVRTTPPHNRSHKTAHKSPHKSPKMQRTSPHNSFFIHAIQ